MAGWNLRDYRDPGDHGRSVQYLSHPEHVEGSVQLQFVILENGDKHLFDSHLIVNPASPFLSCPSVAGFPSGSY